MKKKVYVLALALIVALCFALFAACDNGETGGGDETDMRATVKVTFHGGGSDIEVSLKVGDKVVMPSDPEKAGYTFVGWFADDEFQTEFDEEKLYDADTEAWAKFNANTDTAYKIEYYLQSVSGDEYTMDGTLTENKTGTTDTTATLTADDEKTVEHFTLDEDSTLAVKSGNIAGDGSLVLKLYYTRNSYTVTFKNGDATLATEQVKYEEIPEYSGATPEKAATDDTFYAFKGWNTEIVAAAANCEYSAEYLEIPNYENYYYGSGEKFRLPEVSSNGFSFVHSLGGKTVDASAEQTAGDVGDLVWKIDVMKNGQKMSEVTQTLEIISHEESLSRIALANSAQYLDRMNYNPAYVSRSYDKTENAFAFLSHTFDSDWSNHIGPSDAFMEAVHGNALINWKKIEFEMKIGSDANGTPSMSFGYAGKDTGVNNASGNNDRMDKFVYSDADGNRVDEANLAKGTWYTVKASFNYVIQNTSNVYFYLFTNGGIQTGTIYLRNIRFGNDMDFEDITLPVGNSTSAITYVAQDTYGRSGVYSFSNSDSPWNGRYEFCASVIKAWNDLYDGGEQHYFKFDACFSGPLFIQYWYNNGTADFSTNSTEFVKVTDSEGNAVATDDCQSNVWYTISIDIKARGSFSDLHIALNQNQTAYFDNFRFE